MFIVSIIMSCILWNVVERKVGSFRYWIGYIHGNASSFFLQNLALLIHSFVLHRFSQQRAGYHLVSIKFIPTKNHLMFASSNLVQPHHPNYFDPSDLKSMVISLPMQQWHIILLFYIILLFWVSTSSKVGHNVSHSSQPKHQHCTSSNVPSRSHLH
jgi:hypothetical protein